jgi:ubiquinone/menaquinone biosynthesis C-methylase UbiE
MKLEPTGERMIMEHYKSSPEDYVIYLLHMASYRFAEPFTRGKRVLDFGCGSGYGSAQIAVSADHVTAVDVADDAIAHARVHFQRANLDFLAIDPAERLPFGDASFDVVLSFQVFEHVSDTSHYLKEIRRVLGPDGQLILITPDRSTRLLPFQKPWNRWHVHEYGKRELEMMLRRHFDQVEVLGMTAKPEMIGYELRRCNRVKWMMLPITLPIIPDRMRVACLNLVHRLRGRRPGQAKEYPFGIEDVLIERDAAPSVNLVAVASRG